MADFFTMESLNGQKEAKQEVFVLGSILSVIVGCYRVLSYCPTVSLPGSLAQHNFVFIIERNIRDTISSTMFVHAAAIAIEEHVYLLLVGHF